MVESLEETVARADRVRAELKALIEQLGAEREAVKVATAEAHEAIQGLRSAVRRGEGGNAPDVESRGS